ncbi:UvrD-helicase domain-containing protein [Treponema zuelzerae]|uniref:DNA 3'-5' helicase II n=1 Tax=Teretinema zuelzerae TaxID=156 RepID=A0AAE3EMG4_9SPIR|nr:UvrD-helicase domain-containing protein [Teretinema zuelzerae]MCD1655999.1 UvrD-helicase domain-containing protein [Teretinema zuelzerae]
MPSKNVITIAAAGSGKSTGIVNEAIANQDKRILITTFTVEGTEELKKIFIEQYQAIPKNVEIMTWMSFLIQECIRPYQLSAFDRLVSRPIFVQGRSTKYFKKTDPRYFFGADDCIFSDKLADFAMLCNAKTDGKVIKRLESIYDLIFIDEFQDFAGYDYDLVIELLQTDITLRIVADPRQGTFSTNESARNAKYKKAGVLKLIEKLELDGLCRIELNNWSYRCNQELCSFSDSIYHDYEKTISRNFERTGHDGIFYISRSQLEEYLQNFQVVILRYDKKTKWLDEKVRNFGAVKGRTYERVLILPNTPIINFLKGQPFSSPAKYYVAFTRAKYSATILCDEELSHPMITKWKT